MFRVGVMSKNIYSRRKSPFGLWIGGWVDPELGIYQWVKKKFPAPAENVTSILYLSKPTLSRLSCHRYLMNIDQF
jgi:hypothetical protein